MSVRLLSQAVVCIYFFTFLYAQTDLSLDIIEGNISTTDRAVQVPLETSTNLLPAAHQLASKIILFQKISELELEAFYIFKVPFFVIYLTLTYTQSCT